MSSPRKFMQIGLYPFLLLSIALIIHLSLVRGWDLKLVYSLTNLALVLSLILIEWRLPLREDWKMSAKSFLRDLKYIGFAGPTIALARVGFGALAIHLSEFYRGPLASAPFWLGLAVFLVVFEFFQYWYHRASHEARCGVGRWLWSVHAAHHLPDRVYVVMHAVFHPLNALFATAVIQLSMIGLGVSPAVFFAAMMIIDLQSLVSHFNFDLRLGWLSYLFAGTETHRYHHSADLREAGNYGNTLMIWDLAFGTFRYRPGVPPARLGLASEEGYPKSEKVLDVLKMPFGA